MFSFYFVSHIYEYMRGYAFAHVIEDKKIDDGVIQNDIPFTETKTEGAADQEEPQENP